MSLPPRNDDGRQGSDSPASAPGRTVAVVRWALVVAAAGLAVFSVARAAVPSEAPAAQLYVCPMHPEATSAEPGLCPACNMRLERRAAPAAPVRAAPVRRVQVERGFRAPATIAVPDARLVSVSARSQGWIASLPVAEVGRRVERGQVLATLDSPELFRLQQKLLNALRWSRSGDPNIQPSHDGNSTGDLTAEARLQLRLAGLADGDIAAIEASGRPRRAVALRAPMGGVVIRKQADRGGFATVGQELFAIADLAVVWAIAEVPESQVAHLRVGGAARFQPTSGSPVDGTITFIHPTALEGTGTVSVRVELPNRDGALRPGMSASVHLAGAPTMVTVVPASSVVDTGRRPVVFVAVGGRHEPRAVELGARVEDDIEVVSGLVEGELVVGEGAFLLEAESRLRATP